MLKTRFAGFALFFAVPTSMCFLSPAISLAAIELDQSSIPTSSSPYAGNFVFIGIPDNSVSFDLAQVFTPTISGTLSSVSLAIVAQTPTAPLMIDIRPAPDVVPQAANSPVLGSALLEPSQMPSSISQGVSTVFTIVDFSSQGISVQAGVPLAIVLRSNVDVNRSGSDSYLWEEATTGTPTGWAWSRTGGTTGAFSSQPNPTSNPNLAFEEFVQVPEPASSAIVSIGSLLMLRRRRAPLA